MSENINTFPKCMRLSKITSKREVYSVQAYHKKQEESQINNVTLHLMELENEESTSPKDSRRKEII